LIGQILAPRLLLGGLSAILLVYALLLTALYFGQRSLLYLPDPTRPRLGPLAELGFREIALTTADGLSLLSWYRPPPDGAPVVAYFHGNGGHLGYRTNRMIRFAQQGLGVLLLEYRGYGGNPGTPSEAGFYTDAAAALDYLSRESVPATRLVIYGESLGSGVAVHMAAGREIGALILEAAFTQLADAAAYHYPFVPVSLLLRDRFDSLSAITAVKAPILVLHGERDLVIPPRFGRALLAAAPEPKEGWFSPDGGHEDLARFGALDAAFDFVARRVGFPPDSAR
jgi:fermentation-respiration switch protein FrsA (DUF1100 family)